MDGCGFESLKRMNHIQLFVVNIEWVYNFSYNEKEMFVLFDVWVFGYPGDYSLGFSRKQQAYS